MEEELEELRPRSVQGVYWDRSGWELHRGSGSDRPPKPQPMAETARARSARNPVRGPWRSSSLFGRSRHYLCWRREHWRFRRGQTSFPDRRGRNHRKFGFFTLQDESSAPLRALVESWNPTGYFKGFRAIRRFKGFPCIYDTFLCFRLFRIKITPFPGTPTTAASSNIHLTLKTRSYIHRACFFLGSGGVEKEC